MGVFLWARYPGRVVSGVAFRVEGVGLEVYGLRFMVQGVGVRGENLRFSGDLESRLWCSVQGSGFSVDGLGLVACC